jgi:hypothetical protein
MISPSSMTIPCEEDFFAGDWLKDKGNVIVTGVPANDVDRVLARICTAYPDTIYINDFNEHDAQANVCVAYHEDSGQNLLDWRLECRLGRWFCMQPPGRLFFLLRTCLCSSDLPAWLQGPDGQPALIIPFVPNANKSQELNVQVIGYDTHGAKHGFAVDLILDRHLPELIASLTNESDECIFVQSSTRKGAEKACKQMMPGTCAYYHAGMSINERRKLETNPPRVTFGTSWPTWPIRTCILKGTMHYNGRERRYEPMSNDDLAAFKVRVISKQCSRLVVMCEQRQNYRTQLALEKPGSEDLKSSLGQHIAEALIQEIREGQCTTMEYLTQSWFPKTLWSRQHPKYDIGPHLISLIDAGLVWKDKDCLWASEVSAVLSRHDLPMTLAPDISQIPPATTSKELVTWLADMIARQFDIRLAFGDKKILDEWQREWGLLSFAKTDNDAQRKVFAWLWTMWNAVDYDTKASFHMQQEALLYNGWMQRITAALLEMTNGRTGSQMLIILDVHVMATAKCAPTGPASLQRQVKGIGVALSRVLCDHALSSPAALANCPSERLDVLCRQYAPFGQRLLNTLPKVTTSLEGSGAVLVIRWRTDYLPYWVVIVSSDDKLVHMEHHQVKKCGSISGADIVYAKILLGSFAGMQAECGLLPKHATQSNCQTARKDVPIIHPINHDRKEKVARDETLESSALKKALVPIVENPPQCMAISVDTSEWIKRFRYRHHDDSDGGEDDAKSSIVDYKIKIYYPKRKNLPIQ